MDSFLAVLSGLIISVMVLCNSELSLVFGAAPALVVVHVVGLALSCLLAAFAKKQPAPQKVPWHLLCGGLIGVFTTYSNIYTVNAAGVSLTVALGLMGQCALSLLIDGFGWFGLPKQRYSGRRLGGLLLIAAGAAAMLLGGGPAGGMPAGQMAAVVALGLLGGASIILSRMVNAGLAARIGVYRSTRMNYLTGLALSVLILLVLRPALAAPPAPQQPMDVFIYLGGALGVAVVAISNKIALRLSALVMTLLVFVSQLAAGVALDLIWTGTLPLGQLAGAALLLGGLLLYQPPRAGPGRQGAGGANL